MDKLTRRESIRRLGEDQILIIFKRAYNGAAQPAFLQSYAAAVCQAPRRDFLEMKRISLFLIEKYNLDSYLRGEPPAPPAILDATPSTPATIEGTRRGRLLICPDRTHYHNDGCYSGDDVA